MPHTMPLQADPRKAALAVLVAFEGKKHLPLDIVLEADTGGHSGLSNRDRALFNAIVYGVLRWRGRLDWIIGRLSTTPFGKISIPVRNILRMALFQMIHLDRIPDSAAIHTAVELAKSQDGPWVARFVNAVLRAFQRQKDRLNWPDPRKDLPKFLSVEKSHPEWLLRRWVQRFGPSETEALCDANNKVPPISIRTNTLKTDRLNLIDAIRPHAETVEASDAAPDAVRIQGLRVPIPSMDAFQAGGFQVQDEAAQLVSCLLAPLPGERVMDACAGRGGKTGHLAQLMKNKGEILAVDREPRRLESLAGEMKRLGIDIVRPACIDLEAGPLDQVRASVDRILLDAPCSGLGVIRRQPEARWAAEKRNLKRFQTHQIALTNAVAPLLKEGGTMVYAVCSMEPEEGPDAIQAFLKTHPEFEIDRKWEGCPQFLLSRMTESGEILTYPHRDDMDGFYAARLIRTG